MLDKSKWPVTDYEWIMYDYERLTDCVLRGIPFYETDLHRFVNFCSWLKLHNLYVGFLIYNFNNSVYYIFISSEQLRSCLCISLAWLDSDYLPSEWRLLAKFCQENILMGVCDNVCCS